MNPFASAVIRYRSLVLAVVSIGTVWFAFHAASLRMDPDLLSYLPRDDDDVRFFRETAKRFFTNEINMIALESDDIFTQDALNDLRKITRAVQNVRGVRHVLGLANLLDVARDPDGSTVVRPLIDPAEVPADAAELSALRDKVLSNAVLVGNLVSGDGRAAMLTLILDPHADKRTAAREIREAATTAAPGRPLVFGGFAMALDTLQSLSTGDVIRWIPLAALAIPLLLFLGTGSLRGTVLPLGTVILAEVWTLGTLSVDGMELTMLTALLPAVILVLGTVPGVYLMVRYEEEERPGGRERTEHVLARESRALLLAGFVILAGFLSLMLSNLTLFKTFGKAAAIGIFWSVALSLTFLPACLSYLSVRPARASSLASPRSRRVAALLARLADFGQRRKTAILFTASAGCLASLLLALGMPRHMNLLSSFPTGSEPHEADRMLREYFGGSQLFQVSFRAGDVRAPAILEQMELLEKRIRLLPNVRYPQSVAGVVKELSRNLNNEPGLPDSLAKIRNMWFMLEGQAFLDAILDKGYTDGVVVARMGDSNPEAVARTLDQVQRLVQETVPEELFLVDLQAQPLPARRAFLEELAARIALKAGLDVRFHTGRDLPEEELAAALGRILLTPPALNASDRQVLETRIETYLSSEESDVRILRPDRIRAVARALAQQESVSPASVETALRGALPRSAWKASPQDLAYTAEFVRILSVQRLRERRLQEAMSAALERTGFDPEDDISPAALREELAADLWGVNNSHLAVDADTWFRITRREKPWESRVEFQVRLTGLPAVNLKYDRILLRAFVYAVVNALVIVLVLLIFLLRSPGYGLAAASVLLVTSLPVLGILSLLRASLDNMTIVYLSVAAGISVMYALPLATRAAEAWAEGDTPDQVLARALSTRGRAVLIHTLALAPGFAVLVFCSLAPLHRLGLMLALAVVLGSLGTLFVLPALVAGVKRPTPEWTRDAPAPGA